ncbi:hypothetical protein SESBI_43844 [Sesbania bispinosa]|nr:hypothetical protein SESBI_43844 [Sesbania bispinosa]
MKPKNSSPCLITVAFSPSISSDDADDERVSSVNNKRKASQPAENVKNPVKAPVVDIEDKDDDWLPPPPKAPSNAQRQRTIDEDSTLKKLRLSAFHSSLKFSIVKF